MSGAKGDAVHSRASTATGGRGAPLTFDPIVTTTVAPATHREAPFLPDEPRVTARPSTASLRNGIRDHGSTGRDDPPRRVVGGSA
jgi:hypothetical protein